MHSQQSIEFHTIDLGGMGHLSILTWIKVHRNHNTLTGLEFSIFEVYKMF